ncbi:MAG: cytochrome c [Alphaproteobacteria bacterium]|jgi:hypothetical protein|nr:cytochrome c [Alphaproteobacteria bacterium]MBT5859720.1 cytochrome c [Alphaproteobacteria bacterium]
MTSFRHFALRWILALAAGLLLTVAVPTIASAQDETRNITRGREVYRDKAQCHWCHGWDGRGAESHMGNGPSLRESFLDLAGLIEVIACGRIGSKMPAHDTKAYDDDRCYGITRADLDEKEVPTPGLAMLRANEIEFVARFLVEQVVQFELTLDYCVRYYGEGASPCAELAPGL